MIFAHTLKQVLQRQKTQTRRLIKTGEIFDPAQKAVLKLGQRIHYQVGKTYAIQPNRGQKAVARLRLTGIRQERVVDINEKDAHAEGYSSCHEFWEAWRHIHGQDADLNIEVWVLEFELCQTEQNP